MRNRAVAAVDVGGTKTLCLLVNENYKILAEKKFKTAPENGCKKFVERLFGALRTIAGTAAQQKVAVIGAGVAWAGKVNERDCTIEAAPNIRCLENVDLDALFKKMLGLKIILGNDVQMAMLAEHQMGAAKGLSHVLGVFFGTGVAGAAIIDGKLYQGASGMGGQVGSILTHHIGGVDTLESHGILDRMASKAAIAGTALGMASKQWAPNLFKEAGTDLSKVTWGALRRAVHAGDKSVDDLIRARMRVAGIALSSVVGFLNPEMLVLGGGLTEEMPRVVRSEVEKGLRAYISPEISKALVVKTAKFKNKAGALGAARMAFETFG